MAFEIVWQAREVHAIFSGDVTAEDLLHATILIQKDPRFDNLRFLIIDHLSVSSFSFDPFVLEEVKAHRLGAFMSNPRVRVAFVASDERLRERILLENGDTMPYPSRVFGDLESARAWCSF